MPFGPFFGPPPRIRDFRLPDAPRTPAEAHRRRRPHPVVSSPVVIAIRFNVGPAFGPFAAGVVMALLAALGCSA